MFIQVFLLKKLPLKAEISQVAIHISNDKREYF